MGFYDMGCDKGFGEGGIVILADFVGFFEDWERVRFLSWCVDESAIGFAAFPVNFFSF